MLLRKVLRAIGSLWFAAVLLVLLLVAMACATVFESAHGTEHTLAAFYRSWWFETLLVLVGVNVLAAMLLRFPFSRRQIGFVLTHVSILMTFSGALVTKHFSVEGKIGIAEGQTVDSLNAAGDVLIVEKRGEQGDAVIDMSRSLRDRFRPADIHDVPALKLGNVQVEVASYLPDSEWIQRVYNDSPALQPAIEAALSPSGRDDPAWVFAGQSAQVGDVPVLFRQVTNREELRGLLSPATTSEPTSKGLVRIEFADATFEFPLEKGLDEAVPLGETGYRARVLRYLPHATVGADKQVVNTSNRPVNPYIEVEIVGSDIREIFKAFAKFPDFPSMHKPSRIEGLKLIFVAGSVDVPATPVEVLGGPAGELYARFNRHADHVVVRRLEVGTPVETPWSDRQFAVLKRYDHARAEWSLESVEPVRTQRDPAVLLRLRGPNETSEAWLQKYRRRQVTIDGTSYELTYADKTVPLGFSVTLERFRLGYYPGTQRPRSYESQITVIDSANGRAQGHVISMNHPASLRGYNFYQSSYRPTPDKTISILSVSRDPGQPIVFAGYIGLMAGMLVILGTRISERPSRLLVQAARNI